MNKFFDHKVCKSLDVVDKYVDPSVQNDIPSKIDTRPVKYFDVKKEKKMENEEERVLGVNSPKNDE